MGQYEQFFVTNIQQEDCSLKLRLAMVPPLGMGLTLVETCAVQDAGAQW